MTFDEAKAALATCSREELRDHAFGDREVYWSLPGADPDAYPYAEGYDGRDAQSVTVGGHTFTGPDAVALLSCGTLTRVESNA